MSAEVSANSGQISSALVLFVDQRHVDLNFGDIHR